MRNDFRALAEFEARQFRNELRSVARSRVRIFMWIASSIAFVFFIVARIVAMHLSGNRAVPFDARTAEMFTGVYLIYIGIAFALALTPGAQFANVPEALFLGGSQIGTRAIFIWLQLRAVWRTLARSFIVIVILATTNNAGGLESARMTVLGLALILVPPAYAFHIAIASDAVRLRVRLFGSVVLAFGVATAFGMIPAAGTVMVSQARGQWWPTLAIAAIALIGICLPPSSDPVPDLVAATRPGGLRGHRLLGKRKRDRNPNGGRTSDWIFDMNGVWVIFSGRLAAFLRQRKPVYFGLGLVGWFVVGLVFGGIAHFDTAVAESVLVVSSLPFVMIVCIVAASVGRDLGAEIRNPLWWAGDATMLSRLGVDSLASVWRFLISSAFVLAGYGAFGHAGTALISFALLAGFVWLSRCCGYLLFAFFPATIDQRGAIAGLRIAILFVLAIPVGAVGAIVTFSQLALVLQVAIVLVVALAQALVLLYFAARRIDGRYEAYLVA